MAPELLALIHFLAEEEPMEHFSKDVRRARELLGLSKPRARILVHQHGRGGQGLFHDACDGQGGALKDG